MGCEASSNQNVVVPSPCQVQPLKEPEQKKSQHRITPENILTGKGPFTIRQTNTKKGLSQKTVLEPISTSLLNSIRNIDTSPVNIKGNTSKPILPDTRTSQNSTVPSHTLQNERDVKRRQRKNKKRKREMQPIQKQLKRLYGL